jgi:hypothetical protein
MLKLHQRLATPLLYHSPVILSSAKLTIFENQLTAKPFLAGHIRFLVFSCLSSLYHDHNMHKIFSLTSGLIGVVNHRLPYDDYPYIFWDDFNGFAKTSGSTIAIFRGFKIAKSPAIEPSSFFNHFDKLHTLTWSCYTPFQINAAQILCTALPSLTTIEFIGYDQTFAELLSHME